jgi:thiamine-monophosphate kinase
MDEARFVQFLEERFPFTHGTGIGDDASVVKCGDFYQLITKDLFIENVHFSLDYYTIEETALKSLAVNLSDIAAMGGEPQYFYLGLGFPRRLSEAANISFFEALEKGCQQWKVELAGGDFSSAAFLYVSITLVGKTRKPVYRSGACAGDLIGITGVTGESAIGLALLKKGIRSGTFIERHKSVSPELTKGAVLAKYVNAMIDVSDGLLLDLSRVLAASKKGAKIRYEDIPVTVEMKDACVVHGLDEYETVLAGGEDYVLLFTVSPGREKKLRKENLEYYIIGEVCNEQAQAVVTHGGKTVTPRTTGYDHFRSSGVHAARAAS